MQKMATLMAYLDFILAQWLTFQNLIQLFLEAICIIQQQERLYIRSKGPLSMTQNGWTVSIKRRMLNDKDISSLIIHFLSFIINYQSLILLVPMTLVNTCTSFVVKVRLNILIVVKMYIQEWHEFAR